MKLQPIAKPFSIHALPDEKTWSADIEEQVESHWRKQQAERKTIFNGSILVVDQISARGMTVQRSQYKYFLAQNEDPSLKERMGISTLAVSGFIQFKSSILVGKRASSVLQEKQQWELVPSGGVSADKIQPDGTVDYYQQLIQELEEETGIRESSVESLNPVLLIEDSSLNVVDIGIEITLKNLEGLLAKSEEYQEIRVVPIKDLNTFCSKNALVSATKVLLENKNLIS